MQKLAPQFTLRSRFFYKDLLAVKYQARKEELITALENATWVCTTTDCWSSYSKNYIGKTVHWYDDKLQRHKACLGVRRLIGKMDYKVLASELDDIYAEFGITKKVEATVTDGGSNFLRAFRVYSTPSKSVTEVENRISDDDESEEEDDPDIFPPTQDVTTGLKAGESSKGCLPIPVWDIFEKAAVCPGGNNKIQSFNCFQF